MSLSLLYCWFMVMLRAAGVVAVMPMPGGITLPPAIRVGIALVLAVLPCGVIPCPAAMPGGALDLIWAAGGEILLGLAMGFIVRLLFASVEVAGRIITQEMGLSGVPGIDTPRPDQEPLAAMLSMFAGLLFFLSGSHLGVLTAFTRSFDLSAAGRGALGAFTGESLATASANVIEVGLRMSAPFIAMNFLVNLAFSILGRAVPRTNVFVLLYSLRGFLGLALLSGFGMLIARYLWIEFDSAPARMLEIVRRY